MVDDERIANARVQLARRVHRHELPGAQYVVLTAERTLLDLQIGTSDAATGEPMQAATLQMAYSVTKIATAVAVMQLVDAGKLVLDAPLSQYWPAHPYATTVTIRSLLAHTAGVPNPMPLDWFRMEGEPLDRDAALRDILARHKKPSADVGKRYHYSNIGYWLLEKAIESASGVDYARYLERHVFSPLSVPPAAVAFDLDPQRPFATGHSRRFSAINAVLHLMTPARYWLRPHRAWSRTARVRPIGRAYGGLFCSASTLAPILQDLLRPQPKLMSASARDQMLTEQHTSDGTPIAGTLGWVIGELNGVRYFGKQGGGLGFHGNVRLYPQLGLGTVFLSNRTEIAPGPIDARSNAIDAAIVERLRHDFGQGGVAR
jgi:D-alanyl-D-alanine carboxypeptidase